MTIYLYSFLVTTGAEKMAQTDPHGWILTLISVLVVFTALVILFGVYSLFGYAFTRKKKEQPKAKSEAVDSEIAAAISAAVNLYFSETIHDPESGRITIVRKPSAWSDKTLNFRKLPR